MRGILRRGFLPVVVLLAGCGGSIGAVDETGTSTDEDAGAAGTPEQKSGFVVVPSSAEHQNAIASALEPPAVTDDGSHALGYLPAPVFIPQDAPAYETAANYPSTFDLRALGKLSPIRDQGACGACWAFATYSSSESTLMPNDAEDFSEDHLNNTHGFDIPACAGGNSLMSIAYLSRWSGPVSEADAPYTGVAHAYAKVPLARKHLTEAFTFPNRVGPLDNDTIKSAVSTYGAMYTTMNWQSPDFKAANNAYYNAGPVAAANHAVAIVGWDDDFSASRFAKAPPGNGAFLVRNSWGTSFGDAGYFHLSYYDAFVGRENVVFQSFDATTDYAAVYQYDHLGQTTALYYPAGSTYSANVFTAQAETGLQAVSFYTTQPASQVTITVYDAPALSPTSGTLIGTTQAAEPYAGFHTVSVSDQSIKLHTGRKFSVVINVATTAAKSYVAIESPFPGYSSKVVATAGTGFVSADGAAWTDSAKTWKANVPIKALVGASPSCDDKNACTTDAWDGSQCTHTPAAAGVTCRAAAGACDTPEVCDGTGAACPVDSFIGAGTLCRPTAGDCDQAETCTGKAAACPVDAFQPQVAVCRAAKGVCDVTEHCSGAAAACPVDSMQKKGTACRASIGACDAAEACDGVNVECPADKAAAKGTSCRAKAGVCDVAESCDGISKVCPIDAFASSDLVCRASTGVCDVAEKCSGRSAGCPADGFQPYGDVCRAASGDCDVAEVCSGKTATCAADGVRPKGYVCRSLPVTACSGTTKVCGSK